MGIVIGIDVGISTTKIVGIRDGHVVSPIRVKATDPVTSLYGAFGKYLYDNKIQLSDVEHDAYRCWQRIYKRTCLWLAYR